jgi:hypothetical protein
MRYQVSVFVATTLTVILGVVATRAQDPPVTMGSLVLRMAMSDTSVRPVLVASAVHPEAGIRAVTARIAGTGAHAAMADA